MKKTLLALACLVAASVAFCEVQIINGVKYICTEDGMCMPVEEESDGEFTSGVLADAEDASPQISGIDAAETRLGQGYMGVDEFIAFLNGDPVEGGLLEGKSMWIILLIALLGGLAMNLTPCVLPMVPINLMIIGKSAVRGIWYGAGIAVAYGALGVLASVGGLAFGEIQGNAWFNGIVAVLFVVLSLALFDVFFIDLSRFRKVGGAAEKRTKAPLVFAFSMGALSAVLSGACVAPILISVLLLTADLFAKGNYIALGLPFVMGVGMALPWPFAGAGMQVLPKPGGWMKHVNRVFGLVVLGFAARYAYLAFASVVADASGGMGESMVAHAPDSAAQTDYTVVDAVPATFEKVFEGAKRPVLVDCWASWCKNCSAMERGTLRDPKVVSALDGFTIIRLQAEDMRDLKSLKGFEGVMGLPAFLIIK